MRRTTVRIFVISSMGSYGNDTALYAAMAKSNMLFVCAAGNDGKNLNNMPVYPGSYDLDNVICVANIKIRRNYKPAF